MNSYDLFVSYSRRDNAEGRVTALVGQISRDFESFAGRPLRPFFDLEEIRGMDDWRHRILRGLRESRLLLALLSPSYLKSEYCEWEFNEYLKHEIGEGLVSEGIAPIYFIEVEGWADRDFEQRSAEWVAELRRRQHFDLQPWYDQGEEALRTEAVRERMTDLAERIRDRVRRGELREKAKGNIDRFNVNFSGRAAEMRLLRESASLKQVGVLTAVQGLGGIGKTALACAYAHIYSAEYPGGCWQVKCEGREDLRAALVSLAGARDFEFEFSDEEKRDLDLGFERVVRELKKRADQAEPKRVLLILDNVDKPELLSPGQTRRLPSADWLHILATTRLGEAEVGRAPDRCFVAINELSEKEAVDLIEKWQPEGTFPNEAEREAAHGLARLLGGFTLAVEAAAVYLGQNASEVSCAGFRARLEEEGLGGLEEAVSDPAVRVRHEEKRLSATLETTLERLSPAEGLVMTYAALLPADYVVLPWIRPLAAKEFPELGEEAEPGYPDRWGKLLNRLISLRFFQQTAEIEIVRVHRLVQELIRQKEEARLGRRPERETEVGRDRWARRFDAAGPAVPPHPKNPPGRTEAGRLDRLEAALIAEVEKRGGILFRDWVKPETRWELKPLAACAELWMGKERREADGAQIATLAAEPMSNLARYAEAEALFRRALAIRERSFGPEDLRVALVLNNLGALLEDTNRLAEAEAFFRRALAIHEKNLSPDHPDVASSLNNLGALLKDTNRLAEAEALYRRSLAIAEKSLGPDHPDVALRLNNLANVLRDTSREAEAEPLYQRALAILERSRGADHPDFSLPLDNLAILFVKTQRPAEAESLYRRALDIRERTLGPDHPNVARSLNNLAHLLFETKPPAEAEPLYRRALEIRKKNFDPDNSEIGESLLSLAKVLRETGCHGEAEPLYRRALAIREKNFGSDDPGVAIILYDLAGLLKDTGRQDEAEQLTRRVSAILEKKRSQSGLDIASALDRPAPSKIDAKQAETEALYRRTLASQEKSLGSDHPDIVPAVNNLANLLIETKRPAEAETLYRRALEIRERNFGPNDPTLASLLNNLALLLSDANRLADAEILYRRALAIREANLGSDDLELAISFHNLAALLYKANRLAEAEPLLRRALAVRQKGLDPDDLDLAVSLHSLANLFRDTGRLAEAEPLSRRVLAIQEKNFGPDDPSVAQALLNLIDLLGKLNRLAEAAPLYRRALAIREKNIRLGLPEVAPIGNRPGAIPKKTNWLAKLLKGSKKRG